MFVLRRHPIAGAEDLPNHSLLHLDRRHWEDVGWSPVDWTLWLAKFGIDHEPPHPLVTFNNYPMLVDAALNGEGMALGWRHLSERHLAKGWLVRPVDEEWDFERSYCLALHQRAAPSPELTALHDWLLREAQPAVIVYRCNAADQCVHPQPHCRICGAWMIVPQGFPISKSPPSYSISSLIAAQIFNLRFKPSTWGDGLGPEIPR